MIFDSNIFILLSKAEHAHLRVWFVDQSPSASDISKVEVLGFHKLSPTEKSELEDLFNIVKLYPITDNVIEKAIQLRQAKNIGLGDSIIAATALVLGHELQTHNTKDFSNIPGLIVHDPITTAP